MFKMLLGIMLSFCFLGVPKSYAQENKLTAKHGGVIKITKDAYIELVQEKEKTKVYIMGKDDHRNLASEKLSLSAIAYVKGKEYPLNLTFENDHYSASPISTFMQKEKNFVLKFTITFPGSTQNAVFNVNNH